MGGAASARLSIGVQGAVKLAALLGPKADLDLYLELASSWTAKDFWEMSANLNYGLDATLGVTLSLWKIQIAEFTRPLTLIPSTVLWSGKIPFWTTLTGTVVDAVTKNPLVQARIAVKIGDDTFQATTDSAGTFRLDVPPAVTEVEYSKTDYTTKKLAPKGLILPNRVFNFKLAETVYDQGIIELTTGSEVKITGDNVLYQLKKDEKEHAHGFTAVADPPGAFRYDWSLGDGKSTSQTKAKGESSTVNHSYPAGFYTVEVRLMQEVDGQWKEISKDSKTITIVEDLREQEELTEADIDKWRAAQSGGYGTTVDVWDISSLPNGVTFDIRYNAYSVPDKYIIQYSGNTVLNTGWRGSSSYSYPGGIAGPGQGQVDGLFLKTPGKTSFMVTVYGGESGTAWDYEIRARRP